MLYPESLARGARLSLWFLIAIGVAGAQVYPPGGGGSPYPGGGGSPYPGRSPYPGGGSGSPLPIPGRRGQSKPKTDTNQPYPNFRGTLKRMDDKNISLELGDNR